MSSGATAFRDDKQETVVVRPYPQPQTHPLPHGIAPTLPPPLPQHLPIQPGTSVSVSAVPSHLPQGLSLAFTEGPLKVHGLGPLILKIPSVYQADPSYLLPENVKCWQIFAYITLLFTPVCPEDDHAKPCDSSSPCVNTGPPHPPF